MPVEYCSKAKRVAEMFVICENIGGPRGYLLSEMKSEKIWHVKFISTYVESKK